MINSKQFSIDNHFHNNEITQNSIQLSINTTNPDYNNNDGSTSPNIFEYSTHNEIIGMYSSLPGVIICVLINGPGAQITIDYNVFERIGEHKYYEIMYDIHKLALEFDRNKRIYNVL